MGYLSGVRNVAIIGAGIGGLTLAHALKKLGTNVQTVHVYDQFDSIKPSLGAGFGLNGGAVLLARLGFEDAMASALTPLRTLKAYSDKGQVLFKVDMTKETMHLKDKFVYYGRSYMGQAMRSDVHGMLAKALPAGILIPGHRLCDVRVFEDGVRCVFENGVVTNKYDLVVGADGLRSAVRKTIFGPFEPKFLGMQIHFGVSDRAIRPDPCQVTVNMGDGISALSFSAGGEKRHDIIAVTTRTKTNRPMVWDSVEAREQCQDILASKGLLPEFQEIAACGTRMFALGLHHHEELPTWRRGDRLVLLGDSAHATSPFIGQGANQAIQDAYSLADKLAGLNDGRFSSTSQALEEYEKVRKPTTSRIVALSQLQGQLETAGGWQTHLRNLFFSQVYAQPLFLKQLSKLISPVV